MGRKLHVTSICGLGDYITFCARMKNLREREGIDHVTVWIGAFSGAEKIKEILSYQTGIIDEVHIIDNFMNHSQAETIFKYIKNKKAEKGDLVLDFSFVKEIFMHEEVPFMKYDIQYPYELGLSEDVEDWADKFFETRGLNKEGVKTVVVQAITSLGNVEGLSHDIQAGRFWSQENYREMVERFIDNGYTVLLTGIPGEEWGLDELVDNQNVISCIGLDIPRTIGILKRCDGNFSCNSWGWEITSRMGKPTFCFYTKNEFFIKLHIPEDNPEYFKHTHIETDKSCSVEAAWRMWEALEEKRDLKEEIKISSATITQNCVKDIGKVMRNLKGHVQEMIVIDSNSRDGTDKIAAHLGAKVITRQFEDDFAAQKNFALENCEHDWRILVDSDETLHPLFLNQMHHWVFMHPECDSFFLPRENIVQGISEEEIEQRGLVVDELGRIAWSDPQNRLSYRWYKYSGSVHEQLVVDESLAPKQK